MKGVRSIALGVLAMLLAVLVAIPALGGTSDRAAAVKSSTTLAFSGPSGFSGKVAAAKKPCRDRRTVLLTNEAGATVGSAASAKSGAWSLIFDPPAAGGTYTAQVKKAKVKTNGKKVKCGPGESPPVEVASDPPTPPTTHELEVDTAGSGGGSVSSNPAGISCGSDCSQDYTAGTAVTLTASAGAGSVFSGWSGAGCSGTGTCQVTMSQARSVTASFTTTQFRLDVVRAGTGEGTVTSNPAGIACGANCSELFDANTLVTLSATPATDSEFAGWSGAGCSGTGACEVTMSQARSVTATFTLQTFELSVTNEGAGGSVSSSPAGIDCGADCSETYDAGTVVHLTAEAGPGSDFIGWSGGGCSGSSASCSVTMSQARSVTADFLLEAHGLEVSRAGSGNGTVTSSPGGINCGADCGQTYLSNDTVTLTATPGSGSTFAGWSGGGCSGNGTCQVTMSQGRSVTATFTKDQFRLDVAKTGDGGGTVTSSPAGITCGSNCSELFDANQVVTLTAVADGSSDFLGWGGGVCTGTANCQVTMDQAQSVSANFTPKNYELTITKDGTTAPGGGGLVRSTPGDIFCGNTCADSFDAGTVVTLTADPFSDHNFTGFAGCTMIGDTTCQVTMDQVRNVTAFFSPIQYSLNYIRTGAGTGTITGSGGFSCQQSCGQQFRAGTQVGLLANPGAGMAFLGWGGACAGNGAGSECLLFMNSNRDISATFVPNTLTVIRTGSGDGTVQSTSDFAIFCGGICEHNYSWRQQVTLLATPEPGSAFAGWTGAGCSGTSPTCQIAMDAPTNVRARFIELAELTVSKTGSGSGTVTSNPAGIDCGADCTASFERDSTVTLTANPDPGHEFVGWSGDACDGFIADTCDVTLDEAKSVTAEFRIRYGIRVVKEGGGTGTVQSSPPGIDCGDTCVGDFSDGTTVTLVATPDPGFTFSGWGSDCASFGTDPCVLPMTTSYSVSATFDP